MSWSPEWWQPALMMFFLLHNFINRIDPLTKRMHTHAQPTFHENDKMTTAAVYISTLVSVITKQIEGSVSNKARAAVSLTNVLLPTASVREMKLGHIKETLHWWLLSVHAKVHVHVWMPAEDKRFSSNQLSDSCTKIHNFQTLVIS